MIAILGYQLLFISFCKLDASNWLGILLHRHILLTHFFTTKVDHFTIGDRDKMI